jgi:DNA-binding NarL/FixJ family response regulator
MTMLFADDQLVELTGLRFLVADRFQPSHVVTDPEEVAATAASAGSTLVISGFFRSHRGRPAFDVVRSLRQELPDVPLLIRAPHDDPHLRIGLQRLGASGLIATTASLEQLGRTIVSVCSGRPSFTPIPVGTPLLTTRDLRMLQALGAGAGHKELATRLATSRTAIDKRLAKLRERFAVPSTTALVAWMIERGLTHLPPESLETDGQYSGAAEQQDSRTAGQPMMARQAPNRNPELCGR